MSRKNINVGIPDVQHIFNISANAFCRFKQRTGIRLCGYAFRLSLSIINQVSEKMLYKSLCCAVVFIGYDGGFYPLFTKSAE